LLEAVGAEEGVSPESILSRILSMNGDIEAAGCAASASEIRAKAPIGRLRYREAL
jgi:hypothetical protein